MTIGDGAYVGSGSVITEDVPADALALGRARQVNKPDWARARPASASAMQNAGARCAPQERRRKPRGKKKAKTKR